MRTVFFVSCLFLALSAHAEIYQYKDASGRTVYTDKPQSVTVKPRGQAGSPTDTTTEHEAAPAANPQKSAADREMEFKKRQKEQQEAAEKSEKEAADKKARQENCARARSQLSQLESGERITVRDEKGERAFMEDKQRASETDRTRKTVADLCR